MNPFDALSDPLACEVSVGLFRALVWPPDEAHCVEVRPLALLALFCGPAVLIWLVRWRMRAAVPPRPPQAPVLRTATKAGREAALASRDDRP